MSTTPRKKVPAKIKKEARKLFESGMDMYDVAIELKLNINTLYNLSSKEGWEKGVLSELLYMKEQEILTEKIAERRVDRMETYRVLTKGVTDIAAASQTTLRNGKVILDMEGSIALANHAKAIQTNFMIEKELYGIMSPSQELELSVQRMKYEELKRKLDVSNNEGDIEL
ncbi:MAG: hypothetical protein ACRCY7_03255 [Cetobacterium sp.]|uniref:hypothetical protein n=1 Tax=Cetobacterium sp. TaxID=2071632 RepID=UPI003F381373